MSRYPHTMTVMQSEAATQDADGNIVIPESTEAVTLPCREEAGAASQRVVVDGVAIEYRSVVYLPVDTPAIPNFVTIEVTDGDGVRIRGTVKRFVRDRLNCRIWV